MTIYEHTAYRAALNEKIREWKARAPSRTLTKLAELVGIQVSYLSNVLKDRAHLSGDQLFELCTHLSLAPLETDYLLLLQEMERTALHHRRELLKARAETLRAQQLQTSEQLKAEKVRLSPEELERYYLDPYVQLVHIYLGIGKGARAKEIGEHFGLPVDHVERILQVLETVGYIRRENGMYRATMDGLHLPKESPIALPHLLLMRMKSMDQMQRLKSNERYLFSATISTSPKVREQLEREFIRFLSTAESMVSASPSEELYQINFDLFPWRSVR